jgi:hypothetical protein
MMTYELHRTGPATALARMPHDTGTVTSNDLRALADVMDSDNALGQTAVHSVRISASGDRLSVAMHVQMANLPGERAPLCDLWAHALGAQPASGRAGADEHGEYLDHAIEYTGRNEQGQVHIKVYGRESL